VSCLPTVVRIAHFVVLLLGVSLAARSATAPTASDLAHCAAITAPAARLACYDSLAGAPNRTPAAAVAAPSAGAGATGAPTASVPAAPPAPAPSATPVPVAKQSQAPAPVAASAQVSAPAPPAAPAAALNDPRNFGFSPAQLHTLPQGPQSIQARVANISRNRTGTAYLALDNGQTWTYTDEDSRLGPGDLVTIKRAMLGAFLMTTPTKRSYHVQRVQ
jgi:hypothetical protein